MQRTSASMSNASPLTECELAVFLCQPHWQGSRAQAKITNFAGVRSRRCGVPVEGAPGAGREGMHLPALYHNSVYPAPLRRATWRGPSGDVVMAAEEHCNVTDR